MTVKLRTAEQIAKMRVAGQLAAEVLELIGEYVVPVYPPKSLIASVMIILLMFKKPFLLAWAIEVFLNLFAPLLTRWSVMVFPRIKRSLKKATSLISMSP